MITAISEKNVKNAEIIFGHLTTMQRFVEINRVYPLRLLVSR